ncbi:MAG: hypothetical protein IPL59_01525 [Candidatus Competibacteraceae bacterium]|nr:hypothetical protein [Candidatus Competibacteraceae bacterium]
MPILEFISAIRYFIQKICPSIRGGFRRFKSIYVSQIPIPVATPTDQAELETLVQCILENPNTGDVAAQEAEINERVYRLFSLTGEEIKLIEAD